MSSGTIAFLDSGIGGIPYLLATRDALPAPRLAYYADNLNFPYGERSVSELRRLVLEAAERVVSLTEPAVIVVACNTASVVALATLREAFPIPFVGVVPAIKPAASLAAHGRIGVLATSRTVEDEYVSDLITRFAPSAEVILEPAGGLVQIVEERLGSLADDELVAALDEPLRRLRRARVDAVVLGCTHFIHVRPTIERLLGPGIRVVDSVEGVVRQTARVAAAATTDGSDGGAGNLASARTSETDPSPLYLSAPDRAGSSYRHLARAHDFELRDAHARHSAHR
jgi:glutamate racemase